MADETSVDDRLPPESAVDKPAPVAATEPVVVVHDEGYEPTCEFVWNDDIYQARLAARAFSAD